MKLLNFQKMRNENVSQPSWSQQQKHQKKKMKKNENEFFYTY